MWFFQMHPINNYKTYTLHFNHKKLKFTARVYCNESKGKRHRKALGPFHKEDTPRLALFCVWLYWETSYSQLIL